MISHAEQVSPKGVDDQTPRRRLDFRQGFDLGRLHEMATAVALVGFIVLLLLGSWRATVIVWTVDPAVHPHRDHRSALAPRDDQCHDPGRIGAGRRHSGR